MGVQDIESHGVTEVSIEDTDENDSGTIVEEKSIDDTDLEETSDQLRYRPLLHLLQDSGPERLGARGAYLTRLPSGLALKITLC
ncbi:hypothetical protein CsatA_023437 [Cannabis sativa]|uniref:Uncharacterized protein n=1 Tax=Cannabis sativa TaxID=3483 RepID=A0A803R967_CANSA